MEEHKWRCKVCKFLNPTYITDEDGQTIEPKQMVEKYKNMAREAYSSGDRVEAERYYQYADHYYRVVMASQPVARPEVRTPPPAPMIKKEEPVKKEESVQKEEPVKKVEPAKKVVVKEEVDPTQ